MFELADQDGGDPRWNENVDTFIHALRAVYGYLYRQRGITRVKGKEKSYQNDITSGWVDAKVQWRDSNERS